MNSLGASGSRKGGGGKAASEKHGRKKEFYSGVGKRQGEKGHEEMSKEGTQLKTQGSGDKAAAKAAAMEALAALKRAREPFISDESQIGAADETTLVMDSGGSSDCEVLMEEGPSAAGQRFGHGGWVAGGGVGDENEEIEKEVEGEQGADPRPLGGQQSGEEHSSKLKSNPTKQQKQTGSGEQRMSWTQSVSQSMIHRMRVSDCEMGSGIHVM